MIRGSLARLAAGCVLAVCGWSCQRPPPPPPRSLVLITADTLRADRLGAYGHPQIRTPHLDQLARRSRQFVHCYSQYPLTVPSHASLMTSRYPDDLEMWTNRATLPPAADTLAEFLQGNGFRTAAFTSGILSFACGLDQGFEQMTLRRKGAERRPVTELLRAAGAPSAGADHGFATAGDLIQQAVAWLDGLAAGERYFLWLHLWEPHMAYDPDPPYDRVYNRLPPGSYRSGPRLLMGRAPDQPPLTEVEIQEVTGLYDGEVSVMDQALGALFRALSGRSGPPPLLVFTSDHGESLRGARSYFGHGQGLFEDEVAVPLLINRGLHGPPGELSGRIAELIDIAPTALSALDVNPGQWPRGKDLWAANGAGADAGAARMLLGSHFQAAVDGSTKILRDEADGSVYRYDLLTDPEERRPVDLDSASGGPAVDRLLGLMAPRPPAARAPTPEASDERLEALDALGYVN